MFVPYLIDKLTVITTPHYGHFYLKRFLLYYQQYNNPVKLLILDSSPEEFTDNLETCDYFKFDHRIRFEEKLYLGLSRIETPYAAICSDDDFLIPAGLQEAVAFLEANSDYALAQGKTFSFYMRNGRQFRVCHSQVGHSIEDDSALSRTLRHLRDYYVTFSAVHRTNVLKYIWEEALSNTYDYRLGELLASLLSLSAGKLKSFDRLFCARRYSHTSTGQTMDNNPKARVTRNNYERFKLCLKEHLLVKGKGQMDNLDNLIDRAMEYYLGRPLWRYFLSNMPVIPPMFRKLKRRFMRFPEIVSEDTEEFENKLSPEEKNDFLAIKKLVEEYSRMNQCQD
uniref:TIGR00180 family glycosyltransferase n=1 Tax=candidate division CPR3 bacterium TaxID=2268181 RepID=A0A7V3J933_UNCC3